MWTAKDTAYRSSYLFMSPKQWSLCSASYQIKFPLLQNDKCHGLIFLFGKDNKYPFSFLRKTSALKLLILFSSSFLWLRSIFDSSLEILFLSTAFLWLQTFSDSPYPEKENTTQGMFWCPFFPLQPVTLHLAL